MTSRVWHPEERSEAERPPTGGDLFLPLILRHCIPQNDKPLHLHPEPPWAGSGRYAQTIHILMPPALAVCASSNTVLRL